MAQIGQHQNSSKGNRLGPADAPLAASWARDLGDKSCRGRKGAGNAWEWRTAWRLL